MAAEVASCQSSRPKELQTEVCLLASCQAEGPVGPSACWEMLEMRLLSDLIIRSGSISDGIHVDKGHVIVHHLILYFHSFIHSLFHFGFIFLLVHQFWPRPPQEHHLPLPLITQLLKPPPSSTTTRPLSLEFKPRLLPEPSNLLYMCLHQ